MVLRRDSLIDACLSVSVIMYILAVFLTGAIEGLSRIAHLSLMAVVASLVLVMATRQLRVRIEPVLILAWGFLLFACLSVAWSTNQFDAAERVTGLFFSILGATAIWVSLWNGLALRTITIAILAAAVCQSGVSLHQYFQLGADRAGGLVRATTLALQLSLSAFVILAGFRPRPERISWPLMLSIGLLVVATLVSGTRKLVFSWAAFMLLFAGYVFTRMRTSRVYLALVLLGLPITVVALLNYGDLMLEPVSELNVYQRTEQLFEPDQGGSAETRLSMASEALTLWSVSPIWGHGFEQFRHIGSFSTYSHNNYVELLANLGVVGLTMYYAMHILLLVRSAGGLARNKAYSGLVFASVLLILLWDIGSVSHTSRVSWIFIVVIGYLSRYRPETYGVKGGAHKASGGIVAHTREGS